MSEYILSCCSPADLSKEHFERIGVHYVCFHYALDGVEYPDDLGQTIPFDEFYRRMSEGADTRTAQVNVSEYVDFFSPFLEEGKDVVHVCLSSGISGTINSARNAALILKERYPERTVYVVDSLGASSGYGLLMDTAAAKRDEGLSAEELADWIEANRLRLHHWFFSSDLTFFVKGGRISKTAGIFGGVFHIKQSAKGDKVYSNTKMKWTCVAEDVRKGKITRFPDDVIVQKNAQTLDDFVNLPEGPDEKAPWE